MKTHATRLLMIGCVGLLLAACRTARMELPAGFAKYKEEPFRAVSADAVRLRVRSIPNNPRAALDVIQKTMEQHFKNQGYRILRNEAIENKDGLQGRLFLTSIATLNGSYRYLSVIYPDDERILLLEAAGLKQDFQKHEAALLRKAKTLSRR